MRLNYIDNIDCLEGLAQIPDGSVDLLLTDIPFNISRDNNFKTMGRHGIDFGQWDRNFNEACLAKFVPKIKPGGSALVFHAFEQFDAVRFALQDLHLKDKLIWQKTNPMPRNRDRRYIGNIEMFSWYVRPGGKWTFNRQCDTYDGSVLVYPTENGGAFKRYHPTQKSLGLITELVKRHSAAGAVVLDPFMGSGTTVVACIRTGRNYIGFELDEKYHAAALGRIAAETEEDDAWML